MFPSAPLLSMCTSKLAAKAGVATSAKRAAAVAIVGMCILVSRTGSDLFAPLEDLLPDPETGSLISLKRREYRAIIATQWF
jgi:hypothetical protein